MFWPTGASEGSSIRPLLSSEILSSLAEHIMPCDSTPRSSPTLITNGLPSAPGGSTAPAMAQIAFMPARTLGAPHTMLSRVPVPASTLHTFRRSAFGWRVTSSTSATTTFENGGATASTSSTSRPDMVNRWASSSEVIFGSTIVRSQFSENCIVRTSELVKLLQEAQIAFVEQAQIVDPVAQHGQALQAGAEREADEFFRIEAEVLHHRRMHLAGARHFQPASFQGPAAEGDVDFGRRLREREVGGTEAHLQVVGLEESLNEV